MHRLAKQTDGQPGSLCAVALQHAYKDVSPRDHGIGAELSQVQHEWWVGYQVFSDCWSTLVGAVHWTVGMTLTMGMAHNFTSCDQPMGALAVMACHRLFAESACSLKMQTYRYYNLNASFA